ncbi:MAG: hypothetical protein II708_05855 [Paludibacteraceae bacterium]|nr:hypothetical protein [Paludibacteraceae bacterium]
MKKREVKQINQLFDEWMGEFLQSNLNKPLPWEYVLECWRRRLIEEYSYVADDYGARFRLWEWIRKNRKQYVLNPHLYDPETRRPLFYDKHGDFIINECVICRSHGTYTNRELFSEFIIIGSKDYWFNRGSKEQQDVKPLKYEKGDESDEQYQI